MSRWMLICLLIITCGFDSLHANEVNPRASVVHIHCTSDKPDYYQPWRMRGQRNGTGSGFIVANQRIITNAHVVADATLVRVRRAGSPRLFIAKVEHIGHDVDLAMLTVEDQTFLKTASYMIFHHCLLSAVLSRPMASLAGVHASPSRKASSLE